VAKHEVQDYPDLASRPVTWQDEVEKFDRLIAGRSITLGLEIKQTVRSLEDIQVDCPFRKFHPACGRVLNGHASMVVPIKNKIRAGPQRRFSPSIRARMSFR
jgi:hypothetical protein